MSKPVVEVENLSKLYHLGSIGATTLQDSVKRWWYHRVGRENELGKIGRRELMIEPDHPQAGPEPNTFWALRDVSFSVQQGEIVGIIGRNGAGKSTLLKLLSRITEPTSGRIVLRGRTGALLEVGTGFHPELTGRENIYMNGAILGMRKREIESKFDEIVAFSEVEKFIDTPVKRYSSGMYVRLAFAVAAHLEPEILIVDEVLAVGDAEFQNKCMGKLDQVSGSGRTVLLVSHQMHIVRSLCTKILLVNQGTLDDTLSASEAISRYMGLKRQGEAELMDVSTLPRDFSALGRIARITHVEHANAEQQAEDQPATFRLRINAEQELSNLILGIYVFKSDKGTLGVAQCPLDSALPPGSSVAQISLEPWQLAPGEYLLGFFVRDRLQDYDCLREFYPLAVRAQHSDLGVWSIGISHGEP